MSTSSKSNNILIFSPHPDDDVLACGGTIINKLAEGNQVFITYMTDGRHSHSDHNMQGIPGCPTPEELKEIRRKEAISAEYLLGVPERNLFFLDYEDRILENFVSEAKVRVKQIVDDITPKEVYYPHETDFHRDHKATAAIVTSVLDKSTHVCQRFTYVIWRQPDTKLDNRSPTKKSLIIDVLELKKKALYEHKSQIGILFPMQPEPILRSNFVETFLSKHEEFLVN